MKTILLINPLIWCSLGLFGQDTFLSYFSGQQINDYVHLVFTTKAGVTCLGTEIERSADSILFTSIGEIPGICGGSESELTYTFDDESPLENVKNFYRIKLGTLGFSGVIGIQFVDFGEGIVITPNPATGSTNVFFSNSQNQLFEFFLFNVQGKEHRSYSTNESTLQIDLLNLSSGIYFLNAIKNGEVVFKEKLIVH